YARVFGTSASVYATVSADPPISLIDDTTGFSMETYDSTSVWIRTRSAPASVRVSRLIGMITTSMTIAALTVQVLRISHSQRFQSQRYARIGMIAVLR